MFVDIEAKYYALLDALLSRRERMIRIRDAYQCRVVDNGIHPGTRRGCANKVKVYNGVLNQIDFMLRFHRKQIVERWGTAAYPLGK